jgi:hypothetical protein
LPEESSSRIWLAAYADDDLIAEPTAAGTEQVDGGIDVFDLEHDAVPTARRGKRAVGHGLTPPAPPPGALSTRRRSPRSGIVNQGAVCPGSPQSKAIAVSTSPTM